MYAFEPTPETFTRLEETLKLNQAENVVPLRSAVGERESTAIMQVFDTANSSWNSFTAPDANLKPTGTAEVRVTTLDAFAKKEGLEQIQFVKIDVEGHELSVLKGASALLREKRIKVLSFEVTEMHTKDAGEIFALLRSYGYTVDDYDPTRIHHNYYAAA